MTIQHTAIHAPGHVEYRQNPKDPRVVEKRISANRWEVVRRCATPTDARAVLFQLAGKPQPQAQGK